MAVTFWAPSTVETPETAAHQVCATRPVGLGVSHARQAAVCPGQANALHPLMVIGGLAPSEREALLGGDTLHGERVFIAYM